MIRDDGDVFNGVNIINYDRLDRLDVSQFSGVILDESSILKTSLAKRAISWSMRFETRRTGWRARLHQARTIIPS